MQYKPVIGLEIHAQLNTRTKMFCDSLNDPDEKRPNWNVCPICMGHPGTFPVTNIEAVHKVIRTGLALNCVIAHDTFFERKNYFYPDLPKGYQISQYHKSLCEHGTLTIKGGKNIRITRIHLEEDAGRLYHEGDASLVDYNRASTPLMEMVTEADFETSQEVRDFATELQLILRYLGVSDADMEKGLMRVEVNISLTNADGSWGTKVEVKNINSISAAAASVDYEIKRQREVLEVGDKVAQETRGWDDTKKATISQRSKEEAHDYRYFPEPDLPPLHFEESDIEAIRVELPELPSQRRERFKEYGLPLADIQVFTANKELGDFYEYIASELDLATKDYHRSKGRAGDEPVEPHVKNKLHTLAANYLITELQKHLAGTNPTNTKVIPESFAKLMVLIFHKELSSSAAQTVIEEMFTTGKSPEMIIKEKDLGQVSDIGTLDAIVDAAIATNPKAVEDYKAGKSVSLKFLVGMAMRESRGKGNPQVLEEIIKQKLK